MFLRINLQIACSDSHSVADNEEAVVGSPGLVGRVMKSKLTCRETPRQRTIYLPIIHEKPEAQRDCMVRWGTILWLLTLHLGQREDSVSLVA